jgi:hypothetical protein
MSSAVPSADDGLDCVSGPDPGSEDAAMSRVFNRRRPKRRPVAVLRARSAEGAVLNENTWELEKERA